MKLTIELVPKSSWYSNVRSCVSKMEWDTIRHKCYKKANYKCEICGEVGKIHPVECHEIWKFDDKNEIQKLVGLISLCPNCHKTKHVGLSQVRGEIEIVITQLNKVNNMNRKEALSYINEAFKIWRKRNLIKWELDIDYLKEYLR